MNSCLLNFDFFFCFQNKWKQWRRWWIWFNRRSRTYRSYCRNRTTSNGTWFTSEHRYGNKILSMNQWNIRFGDLCHGTLLVQSFFMVSMGTKVLLWTDVVAFTCNPFYIIQLQLLNHIDIISLQNFFNIKNRNRVNLHLDIYFEFFW